MTVTSHFIWLYLKFFYVKNNWYSEGDIYLPSEGGNMNESAYGALFVLKINYTAFNYFIFNL